MANGEVLHNEQGLLVRVKSNGEHKLRLDHADREAKFEEFPLRVRLYFEHVDIYGSKAGQHYSDYVKVAMKKTIESAGELRSLIVQVLKVTNPP